MDKTRSQFDGARARALYDQGLPDTRIAEAIGRARNWVQRWRARENLPALYAQGDPYTPAKDVLTPQERAKRKETVKRLLCEGMSCRAVSEKVGFPFSSVRRVRAMLPPDTPGLHPSGGFHIGKRQADTPAFRDAIYTRIANAVSRYIAPDLRDDVISDTYLALLEGDLAEGDIEARIKRFENRVVGSFANKWGARSLDEEIGDDGFTLGSVLPDPSALNAFDVALYRGLYGELPQ